MEQGDFILTDFAGMVVLAAKPQFLRFHPEILQISSSGSCFRNKFLPEIQKRL
jgi:hypothetical protein